MLRSIGQNPTEDEILNLVIEYDVNGDGTIDFDEFLEMMSKQTKEVDQVKYEKEHSRDLIGFERSGGKHVVLRLQRCQI